MESNHTIFFPPTRFPPVPVTQILEEKLLNFIHFLMFSSIFVGMACGSMVYVASFIQGIECNPVCILIMFLVCFSVYNLNRKTDEAEDVINRQDRYSFTKKYEKHLYLAAISGCCLAFGLAFGYGWMTFFVVLLPFIAGILYSIPFLPPSTGYRRLKEIPVVKNLVVSAAWAAPLTFIAITTSHAPVTSATAINLIFFLGWAFIASTLPDVRDKEGDEQAGIRTIPVVIGVERTMMLVTGINIFVGIITALLSLIFLTPAVALLIGVSTVYLHLSIRSFSRTKRKDIIFDILNDGQFLIIGFIVYCVAALQSIVHLGYL
jgi:4-hydroxybenzoate polyprenyltransferase